jgi:tetratricopeptide (TPR) repeat protein
LAAQETDWQTLVNEKRFMQVIAQVPGLTAADSSDVHKMNALAQAYEGILRYRDAVGYYRLCYAMDTTDVNCMNSLARTLAQAGDLREASAYFHKVLERDSTNFYANLQLAQLAVQTADYAKAIHYYMYLCSLDSLNDTNPALHGAIGDCFSQLSLYPFALGEYRRAFGLNPGDSHIAHALINTMLRLQMPTDSILLVCDKALSRDTANVLLREDKGMTLFSGKRYFAADSVYSGLLADGDSSYMTLKYTGFSRYYAELYMDAIEPLEAAYKADTTSVDVNLFLGTALGLTYDRKRAYRLFDQAERFMQPDSALTYMLGFSRASTYERDGRFGDAISAYYKVWLASPRHFEPLTKLLYLYASPPHGKKDDASWMAQKMYVQILFARNYLKRKEVDSVQVRFLLQALQDIRKEAFFRDWKENLPLLTPDGRKVSVPIPKLDTLIELASREAKGRKEGAL